MAVRGTVDSGAGGTLVTSVTGTAAEITVTPNTGAVVVSLPAALTFTGKTVTGGTFASPTFTGTTTFPDGSTWTSSGLSSAASSPLLFNAAAGNQIEFSFGNVLFYDMTTSAFVPLSTYGLGTGTFPWGTAFISGLLTLGGGTLLATSTALTNGAGAQIATMTNGPTAGNPTKWIPIVDNGTTRYIPAW